MVVLDGFSWRWMAEKKVKVDGRMRIGEFSAQQQPFNNDRQLRFFQALAHRAVFFRFARLALSPGKLGITRQRAIRSSGSHEVRSQVLDNGDADSFWRELAHSGPFTRNSPKTLWRIDSSRYSEAVLRYQPGFRRSSLAIHDGSLGLGQLSVGGRRSHNVIAAVDMQCFSGHAAGHIAQQIDGALADFFQTDIATHR